MDPQPLAERVPLPVVLVTSDTARDFVNRAYDAERMVVFQYLLSLGVNRDAALDLTQEVFLRLYQTARRGERIRTLRAWLFTTASRLAIDEHRKSERSPLVGGAEVDRWLEALPDRAPSPETAALQRERLTRLGKAFNTLSPQQRVCLHLRAEGLRYREIAETLGVGISTVSQFMHRAIARLRSVLNG